MFTGLPKYKATRPVEFWSTAVPAHWQVVPGIAVIAENKARNTGLAESQVLSLSYGRVIVKPVEKQRGLVPDSYEGYQILEPGDIVIRPTDLQNDQRSIRVGRVRDRGIITSAYIGLRSKHPWTTDYAYHYLAAIDSTKRIYGMGSGLRQQLGWPDLKRMPCLVPPVDEQAAIVKYLAHANARIDKAIAAKRRLIALLGERQRAVVRECLGASRWQPWPMGRLGRLGNGSTPSRSEPAYWNGDVPWLNSSVVNRSVVDSADQFVTSRALAECHLPMVPAGSVLIGITGQGKTRGMATVLRIEATINQHLAFLTPDPRRASAEYLAFALAAGYDELRRLSDGSGGTKGALTLADLKSYRVPLPPLEEQAIVLRELSARARETEQTVVRVNREIELLQECRTRLVSDVVTGQVDVRELAASLPEPSAGMEAVDLSGDMDELDIDEVAEMSEV
jgi:type I restriction enzyme S subunit